MRQDRGNRRDFGGNRGGGFSAPVKVGDELDVKIEAVGEKGDGIAKKDGFVLFVPGTKKDQNVKIKVTRVLQKVGFAEVVGQKSEGSSEEESQESYEEPAQGPSQESEEEYSGQDSENFGEDDSGN